MEEISGTKSHKLILNNRRTGSFTGILDVLSFDGGEIILETDYVFEGTGGDRKER